LAGASASHSGDLASRRRHRRYATYRVSAVLVRRAPGGDSPGRRQIDDGYVAPRAFRAATALGRRPIPGQPALRADFRHVAACRHYLTCRKATSVLSASSVLLTVRAGAWRLALAKLGGLLDAAGRKRSSPVDQRLFDARV